MSRIAAAVCFVATLVASPTLDSHQSQGIVSDKVASGVQEQPVPLTLGEVVKGRLPESSQTARYHYWLVNIPAGKYKIVVDAKRADDKDTNIGGDLDWFTTDGVRITNAGNMNSIAYRYRWIFSFSATAAQKVVLRYSNTWSVVDYWLSLMPTGDPVQGLFFDKPPSVQPISLGKAGSALLNADVSPDRYGYFSLALPAGDYRVAVTFARADLKSSNVGGTVDVLGPSGELGLANLMNVNEIGLSGKGVSKLSLATDESVIFRVYPSWSKVSATIQVDKWESLQGEQFNRR